MTFDDFKAKAKEYGVKVEFLNKGLYRAIFQQLPDQLDIDNIELIAEGFDKTSTNAVPVIVTDNRVFLTKYKGKFSGPAVTAVSRDKIEAVETSGMALKKVFISTQGSEYTIERVKPDQAQKLAQLFS